MNSKTHTLLLGAHMSIASGIENAIYIGESLGCTAIQIFTKSNRQWAAKKISEKQILLFKQAQHKSKIKIVIAHATYLINIGSPKHDLNKKSVDAVIMELERCDQLGIPYLVLHPGSHLKTGEQECLERISDNLNKILSRASGNTVLLLENMAGQGSSVCYQFEQLAWLYNKSNFKRRLGICFDTCHAFAAGYDFSTPKQYEQMWTDFDNIIGLKNLKAMHLSDSKKNKGSKIDRHETISKGKIGLTGFKLIMNDERFFNIPKILETPVDDPKEYFDELITLKNLISKKNKIALAIKK